jgi:hypothetical protein
MGFTSFNLPQGEKGIEDARERVKKLRAES